MGGVGRNKGREVRFKGCVCVRAVEMRKGIEGGGVIPTCRQVVSRSLEKADEVGKEELEEWAEKAGFSFVSRSQVTVPYSIMHTTANHDISLITRRSVTLARLLLGYRETWK